MKKLFVLFAVFASSSAFADSLILNCRGIEGSEGKALYIESLEETKVPEGKAVKYLVEISKGRKMLFSGTVIGRQNDVQVIFKSSRNASNSISGTVYLDEMDQTSFQLAGEELQFDCGNEE